MERHLGVGQSVWQKSKQTAASSPLSSLPVLLLMRFRGQGLKLSLATSKDSSMRKAHSAVWCEGGGVVKKSSLRGWIGEVAGASGSDGVAAERGWDVDY